MIHHMQIPLDIVSIMYAQVTIMYFISTNGSPVFYLITFSISLSNLLYYIILLTLGLIH